MLLSEEQHIFYVRANLFSMYSTCLVLAFFFIAAGTPLNITME
jgi:hypothetical protein